MCVHCAKAALEVRTKKYRERGERGRQQGNEGRKKSDSVPQNQLGIFELQYGDPIHYLVWHTLLVQLPGPPQLYRLH
jgi:hypothetical protein